MKVDIFPLKITIPKVGICSQKILFLANIYGVVAEQGARRMIFSEEMFGPCTDRTSILAAHNSLQLTHKVTPRTHRLIDLAMISDASKSVQMERRKAGVGRMGQGMNRRMEW